MATVVSLTSPLTLPCGAVLPNRLCKAALTEGLADERNRATERHCRLYSRWAKSGASLLLTGNIQVDRRYMERAGNVAIDGEQDESQLQALRAFAKAATEGGVHCWAQLAHAGRQNDKKVCLEGVAPSAIALKPPNPLDPVVAPRPLTIKEIQDLKGKFAYAAGVCKEVGFTGVQLHSAHGYLLSSFLSPLTNHRTDEYGGSLENRARFLLDTLSAVRRVVGATFPISVKLNSADFQRGGLTHDEAMQVAQWLEEAGVDLLEISGGSYESMAMMGAPKDGTTAREAYFLTFAKDLRARVNKRMPLMVTGGFRRKATMEAALVSDECDMIGVGRPLCGELDCLRRLVGGEIEELPRYEETVRTPWALGWLDHFKAGRALRFGVVQMWFYRQLILVGEGNEVDHSWTPLGSFLFIQKWDGEQAKKLQGIVVVKKE